MTKIKFMTEPNEQVKSLEPCPVPWCRHEKAPYVAHSPGPKTYFVVLCAGCGANAPEMPTKAEAIAAWNRRPLDAEVERLTGEVQQLTESVSKWKSSGDLMQKEKGEAIADWLKVAAERDALVIENLRLQSQAVAVEDYATVKSERDALLGKLRVAQESVNREINHDQDCPFWKWGQCTCGLGRALAAIDCQPSISIDPDRMEGKPCIAGTRIPVTAVLRALTQYVPLEGIATAYPDMTEEQVKEALWWSIRAIDSQPEPKDEN